MTESLAALLARSARRHGDRPAVVGPAHMVTYRELVDQTERLAATLQELGLAGRRIGVLLPNVDAFSLVLYGLLRAGGSAVMLNPLNSPREVEEYLAQADVDTVFTLEPLLALLPGGTRALLVEGLPERLRIRGAGGEHDAELAAVGSEPPALDALPAGEAEAAVLFTAAESGWARGAVLSHRNLIANARSTLEAMQLTPEDRVAGVLPLIHAFGLTVSLNATLAAGAALLPVERFHPVRLLEMLPEQRVTVFAGVPAMYLGLLAAVQRRGAPEHSLRLAIAGGAPLEPHVGRAWEARFGIALRQGYGLTEAGPVCTFNRVDRPNRPGTLGYAFPGVDVAVLAHDGTPLAPGEVGELCVRGDNVFGGYLRGTGEPARFHGNWLRTGDLGSIDADGVVRFRGVLKPMFTRNGFNIYPREVERVLRSDPRVAAVRVCAQPEAARENDIVVLLQPTAGTGLDVAAVQELCRERLAAYKQPTRIDIVDAWPG